MKYPPALILASTSRYRRELLARLGLDFTCAAPHVDEARRVDAHGVHERALAMAERLAKAKAGAVAALHPDAWVIGSDQTALRIDAADDEQVLGKPGSEDACKSQLQSCSGRTVTFITAVAVLRLADQRLLQFTDTTHVSFRMLDAASIDRYVARESPLDCTGGFKCEALGISLCESIDSQDPTALIGLPLIGLSATLRSVGFAVP